MTTQTPTQTATAIIYPESDGQPMPDGEYQFPIHSSAYSTLRVHFRHSLDVRVNGNTFLYYVEGNPHISVSPDCYVATGLSPEQQENINRNNTYRLWEVGKPPDFVMEVASYSTKNADLVGKRELYASLGISEYWRYDHSGGDHYGDPLVGERLVDGEYQPLQMREDEDGRIWAHSDALNLDLYWDNGALRFWDPVAEKWLRNHEEDHDGRLAAEDRANQEQAARVAEQTAREIAESRAEQEQAGRLAEQAAREVAEDRAQAAESRVAALEAQLRKLRGNDNPSP